jgi:hypothetical protein
MLYLDATEHKRLTFETEINGVGCEDLDGFVRFMYEGIEYGFPADIETGIITAVITPLKDIFPTIKSGTIVEARLDVYTDKNIFSPWQDEIEITSPMVVEASLATEKGSGPSVKAKVVKEGGTRGRKPKRKPITEIKEVTRTAKKKVTKEMLNNITEEQVYKLMERLGTTSPKIKEILYNQASSQSKSGKPADVLKEIIKIMGKRKSLKRSGR